MIVFDIAAAFPKAIWRWILNVLHTMLINAVGGLLTNSTGMIFLNEVAQQHVASLVLRGIGQGCPSSGYLVATL